MCLERIREAMLHHRWKEAAEHMVYYPQILEDTHETATALHIKEVGLFLYFILWHATSLDRHMTPHITAHYSPDIELSVSCSQKESFTLLNGFSHIQHILNIHVQTFLPHKDSGIYFRKC